MNNEETINLRSEHDLTVDVRDLRATLRSSGSDVGCVTTILFPWLDIERCTCLFCYLHRTCSEVQKYYHSDPRYCSLGNECIDSTMDHIHVCFLCRLFVTIRGLVVTIGVRFGFLHLEHTTTSRNVLKKRLMVASFQLKSTNVL
jgi:hypothetical protein